MSGPGAGDRDAVRESEVRRIARLAGLSLTDREVRELAADMSTVLGHFRELPGREVGDGGGALEDEPGGGGVPGDGGDRRARDVLRSDEPRPDPLRHGPDAMAPEWREGFFVVPRLAALGRATDEEEVETGRAGASPRGECGAGEGGSES